MISRKEHRRRRKCSALVSAVCSVQIMCLLHKWPALCKTPPRESGITGRPQGSPAFLYTLLEYQWEQTRGTVSFRHFPGQSPVTLSPARFMRCGARCLLCESTEPILLSPPPQGHGTGPGIKFLEPSTKWKDRGSLFKKYWAFHNGNDKALKQERGAFFFKFIYLFMFGCVGSSLLCTGFL